MMADGAVVVAIDEFETVHPVVRAHTYASLFPYFAFRCLLQRFTQPHAAARQRPGAEVGCAAALHQQHLLSMNDQRTASDARRIGIGACCRHCGALPVRMVKMCRATSEPTGTRWRN